MRQRDRYLMNKSNLEPYFSRVLRTSLSVRRSAIWLYNSFNSRNCGKLDDEIWKKRILIILTFQFNIISDKTWNISFRKTGKLFYLKIEQKLDKVLHVKGLRRGDDEVWNGEGQGVMDVRHVCHVTARFLQLFRPWKKNYLEFKQEH